MSAARWVAALMLAVSTVGSAQEFSNGPVVETFGPAVAVPGAEFNLLPGTVYRVLLDVASGSRERHQRNRGLESAARFLNMHARAGIDPEDLRIEIVTHGGTTFDVLSNAAYRERFDRDNPNAELLETLTRAGVVIRQCGQSAAFNGVKADELAPGVTMAVSAMTVMARRKTEGWVLVN